MAEGEEDKERSKYNEANLNIQRLSNCWTNCARYRREASYDAWKWELDTVWTELCQDVKPKRMGNYKAIEKINKRLRAIIGNATDNNELYAALNERQIFLRRLQDKVGKGGSYEDESGGDID